MKRPNRVVGALLVPAAGAVLFGPVLVGALAVFPGAVFAGLLFLLCLYAFSPRNKSAWPRRMIVVALSVCLAATAFDLFARAYRYYVFDDRPKPLIIRAWPPLPQLSRFKPRVRFEGEVYGDLSALSGRKEWREYNRTLFVSDPHGFRNDASEAGPAPAPALILLGDSFGVALRTRQEETLCALLSRAGGRGVYNLSMAAASPWQEYVNLLVEGDRLRAREGGVVVWLLFSGNDLDERYFPYYERSQLPWRGRRGQLADAVRRFRDVSPLRHLLVGRNMPGPESVVEKRFIDGRRLLFLAQYTRNKDLTADEIRRHPNFGMLKTTVAAMKRLAGEKRLRVAVVLVPSKEEVYSWVLDGAPPWTTSAAPSPFSAAVEEMARLNGMPFLDLKPTFVSASRRVFEEQGELLWWNDDTHWNSLAQKIAAEKIQQELLLPLGGSGPGVEVRGAPNSK